MRLKVIKAFYFISIFLIVLKLGYWQILRSDDLTAKAEFQRTIIREAVGVRGEILFNDETILASSEPSFLVFAEPSLIQTKEQLLKDNLAGSGIDSDYRRQFAKKVALIFWEEQQNTLKLLPLKIESTPSAEVKQKTIEEQQKKIEDEIYEKISKNLSWVSLNRKVDLDTRKKIENLNLVGLGFDESNRRFYPEGSSSAHLLGFIGSDIYGNDTGYFGLEGFYNGELKGKKGLLTQEKDAQGIPILIGKFLNRVSKPGKTLVLNIDRSIQHMVEQKLKKGVEKYGAKSGSVVIMEPKTGKIMAMASFPGYDPRITWAYPNELYKNPITADGYEPGSTFKVLVMAAGIEEGVIKPDTRCDICAGPLDIGGFTIRTWNNQYRPNSTMTDVLVNSDNTGMVFIARKLGLDKMYSYIQRFGFGELTGVDLQDEASPTLRPEKDWKEIDLATSSFGQGISVSALQVVRAVAAIANGGKLMEPQVVSKIIEGDNVYKIEPRVVDTPIKEETAQQVTEMMVKAVEEGEARVFKPKGYKIAGKTGTAQIAVAGRYDKDRTIASFIGFAPADDPKFVMLVRYTEPTSSTYGSETAAPTFFEIAREIFNLYGIAPTP